MPSITYWILFCAVSLSWLLCDYIHCMLVKWTLSAVTDQNSLLTDCMCQPHSTGSILGNISLRKLSVGNFAKVKRHNTARSFNTKYNSIPEHSVTIKRTPFFYKEAGQVVRQTLKSDSHTSCIVSIVNVYRLASFILIQQISHATSGALL